MTDAEEMGREIECILSGLRALLDDAKARREARDRACPACEAIALLMRACEASDAAWRLNTSRERDERDKAKADMAAFGWAINLEDLNPYSIAHEIVVKALEKAKAAGLASRETKCQGRTKCMHSCNGGPK